MFSTGITSEKALLTFFDHFATLLDHGLRREILYRKYRFDLRIFLDFPENNQKYFILH